MPSHKTSQPPNVGQTDATGSDRGRPVTTVVPPNHATPTSHNDGPNAVFYNSTLVFDLCWRNKCGLHVWTINVCRSRNGRSDVTSLFKAG